MTMPGSPNETYVASSTPSIKAQTLDDLQTFLSDIYAAIVSLKKMRFDGVGNQAITPTALLELAAGAGVTIPQFATLDALGRARFTFDHNGFPTAYGFGEFWEQWLFAPGSAASPLSQTLGTGAAQAIQAPNANYAARFLQITPSTGTIGTASSLFGPSSGLLYTGANQDVVMEADVGMNAAAAGIASNSSFFFGLDNGIDPFNVNTDGFIGIIKPSVQAPYSLQFVDNGSLHSISVTNIAAPSVSANSVPLDRLRLEYHGAATAIGVAAGNLAVVKAWVNNTSVSVTVGSGVFPFTPASQVKPVIGAYNTNVPAGGPLFWLGPFAVCWNRVLAPAFL